MTSADPAELRGRTVIITGVGAAGQVGAAVAKGFARAAAHVHLIGRKRDDAEARAAELRAEGWLANGYGADLADSHELARLRAQMGDAGITAHALINAAGGFAPSGRLADSDPAVWHAQFHINATTAYLATRAFIPALRAQGGSVVFFTSASVLPGASAAGLTAYAAAKSAVLSLMRTVADEERGHGIRANALAPQAIRTATNEAAMPAGTRFVEMSAVVDAAMFLASDRSRGITGQVISLAP